MKRLPVLSLLEPRAAGIPFVRQLAAIDCGAAALAMVLGYHGKRVLLEDVRKVIGVHRDGTTTQDLLDAGTWFGLRGRALIIELEALPLIPRGSILHWQFRHWLVFDRIQGEHVALVDPASGHRLVSMREFGLSFTGLALELEPGESFQRQSPAPRNVIFRYLAPIVRQSKSLTRIVVLSLFLRLLALALPILTGIVIDRVIPHADLDLFRTVLAGLGGVVIFTFLASQLRGLLNIQLRTCLDAELTFNFIDHLVGLSYEYFQLRPAGDLLMRLSSNAQVREVLTGTVLSSMLDGVMACAYLGLLLFASPAMGLVALLLGVTRITVLILARERQRDLQARALHAQARTTQKQIELIAGIETLKTLGVEQRAAEQYSNAYVDSLNVGLEQGRLGAKLEAAMAALDTLSPLVLLSLGTWFVLRGGMQLGSMLALTAVASAFLAPLASLAMSATSLRVLESHLERLNETLDTPREQANTSVRAAPALRGDVRLEGVSFRYGPTAPLVVNDVSLEIRAGECVAIVGPSGSGKSTLGRLLVGLYTPSSGTVSFDGLDLQGLDHRSVRRQIGSVIQRASLFGGSIRQNVAFGQDDLSLEEVVEAAKLAAIHEDVEAMPLGYETLVPADGGSLSGGQQQRLAIARALARRPPILFFDEATSALDPMTEARVHKGLSNLGCTRILIAHRLSTVRNADRIFVMAEGRVVEVGRHAELLKQQGLYAQLVASQVTEL